MGDDLMLGQWIGKYSGSNAGLIVIELDEVDGVYEGHAYLFENGPQPGTLAFLRTPSREDKQTFTVRSLQILHPQLAQLIGREEFKKQFPGLEFPESAEVTIEHKDDELHVAWVTSIGTAGSAILPKSKADQDSEIRSEAGIRSWRKFKSFIEKTEPNRFVYRGQCSNWRLRTTFHRTRRKDLIKLLRRDIPMLHRAVSSKTKHLFNLDDRKQYAAFWHLAQHHGYPTPFLDWTHSPYVAAFFAFRVRQTSAMPKHSVRLLQFDLKAWREDFRQLEVDSLARPHLSFIEPLAIENDRAIPQQALSAITNLDDVESYVRRQEKTANKRYLRVFDLRYSERLEVLQELSTMGITAGSLFPGIDGACEEMRSRLFDLAS